jgi:plastocyanin
LKRIPNRISHHLVASTMAILLIVGLAACGDSEDEAQRLNFKVELTRDGTVVTAPKRAEAGPATIRYGNNVEGEADLQLIRVEGEHTTKEVVDALTAATEGKPYPEWFFAAGGIGLTEPGDIVTVDQILQPGTYYAFNTTNPVPKKTDSFEVTGEASDEQLDSDAAVRASEYAFESEEPLPAGTNQILFENAGAQPHHMLAAKLIGEATAEDVVKAFKRDKGQPPLDPETSQSTAVIEGGESQLVTFDLEPGRYAFYCFITDRQGGPPHALKGMVDEIEVEESAKE